MAVDKEVVVVFVAMALEARGSHVGSDGKVGFLAVGKEISRGGGGKRHGYIPQRKWLRCNDRSDPSCRGLEPRERRNIGPAPPTREKLLFRDQGHLISEALLVLGDEDGHEGKHRIKHHERVRNQQPHVVQLEHGDKEPQRQKRAPQDRQGTPEVA